MRLTFVASLALLALASSLAVASASAARADEPAAAATAAKPTGLSSEATAGIVVTTGNSRTQSYNLADTSTYAWPLDLVRFDGRFLRTTTQDDETARFWSLGLRYERTLSERFSLFAGELLESNRFAGFQQRYSTDVGAKYTIVKNDAWDWFSEAGYRYVIENRAAAQAKYHLLRLYTDASHHFSKDVSARLWVEALPNLTTSDDYQVNSELSLQAALTSVFSIKTGYLVKYRHLPPPGIARSTDSWFTAALVAKF